MEILLLMVISSLTKCLFFFIFSDETAQGNLEIQDVEQDDA